MAHKSNNILNPTQTDSAEQIRVFKETIYIKLPHENRERNAGHVRGNAWHVWRAFNHEHHETRSWGFNYKILKYFLPVFSPPVKFVVVHTPDGAQHVTTAAYILNNGFFGHYSKKNFELQIFLKISDFGLDKTMDKGQQNPPQSSAPVLPLIPIPPNTPVAQCEISFEGSAE